MGTSSPFGGPGNNTPLLPDWADEVDQDELFPSDGDANPDTNNESPEPDNENEPELTPDNKGPSEPEPIRFRLPRWNFTRYVTSNGTDTGALKNAVRDYVNTGCGGSRNAAQRMGGSRRAAGRILTVLREIQDRGITEVLRELSLESLIGKSPKEILLAFTDVVCAPGGTIDEAIARDAYVETIIELSEITDDLSTLNEEQIDVITVRFITHSIVLRIFIDIGHSLDIQNLTGENADRLSKSTFDIVLGLVQDTLTSEVQKTRNLNSKAIQKVMNKIYQAGFNQLQREIDTL